MISDREPVDFLAALERSFAEHRRIRHPLNVGPMDADCIHGNTWWECPDCAKDYPPAPVESVQP